MLIMSEEAIASYGEANDVQHKAFHFQMERTAFLIVQGELSFLLVNPTRDNHVDFRCQDERDEAFLVNS